MKKTIILMILAAFVLISPAIANDSQRKTSTGRQTASYSIATSPGTVYDIEVVVTTNGGYAVLFDSASTEPGVAGDGQISEIREATAFNSKHVNFGQYGLKFYKGLYLYLNNATANVYYH